MTAIDGIASYSNDRNDSIRVATALGLPELRFTNMFWGGGGGGGSGAIGNAAAAIVAGFATTVVVYRALAQGQFGRFGATPPVRTISGPIAYTWPYGMSTPAQWIALRTRRFMHDHHITQDPLAAIAMACYHHAQSNPRAIMYGRPLTRQAYDDSRWIVEPFHLYDCCLENDGAAAVIVTSAERARDLKQKPAYVMASAQGSDFRQGATAENGPDYATSNFKTLAPRLYAMAGIEPKDVDVAQVYENFTGAVMTSIVEHGFCHPDEVMDFCTFENLTAPNGKLPINTSGGNLAECYMHGLELIIEAARQSPRHVDLPGEGRRDLDGRVGPDGRAGERSDPAQVSAMANNERRIENLPARRDAGARSDARRIGSTNSGKRRSVTSWSCRNAIRAGRSSSAPNGFATSATPSTSDGIAYPAAAASTVGSGCGTQRIPR